MIDAYIHNVVSIKGKLKLIEPKGRSPYYVYDLVFTNRDGVKAEMTIFPDGNPGAQLKVLAGLPQDEAAEWSDEP